MSRQRSWLVFALVTLLLPVGLTAAPTGEIVSVETFSTGLSFRPLVAHAGITLRVTGPRKFSQLDRWDPNKGGVLDTRNFDDGYYRWEARAVPEIPRSIQELLVEARAEGNTEIVCELQDEGILPMDPLAQGGGFRIVNGKILDPTIIEDNKAAAGAGQPTALPGPVAASTPAGGDLTNLVEKDFVILDDLIVDGSACIGFDCVNGESFGFDTIRLKENNLRIKFDDTSIAASFPRTDWQLTANASANGGASKFSIDDISGGRTPFTVEANAPSHSLYVDDGGRVGIRTSTPSTEIHIIDGDTPTVRLQQDGSSGFAPQTWDVAGNETSFFIRDASNGSTLPFRIRPGAGSNVLVIDEDSEVGVGTLSPDATFQVEDNDGDTMILVTELSNTDSNRILVQATNNFGNVQTSFIADAGQASPTEWRQTFRTTDLIFDSQEDGANELQLGTDGNMTIGGTLTENSDVANKKDIVPVDVDAVLAKVAQLPVSTWVYKQDNQGARHMGPTAQDFHAAFGLGATDRGIAAVDRDGVALAAIKALYQQVQQQQQLLEAKDVALLELSRRLEALENATP